MGYSLSDLSGQYNKEVVPKLPAVTDAKCLLSGGSPRLIEQEIEWVREGSAIVAAIFKSRHPELDFGEIYDGFIPDDPAECEALIDQAKEHTDLISKTVGYDLPGDSDTPNIGTPLGSPPPEANPAADGWLSMYLYAMASSLPSILFTSIVSLFSYISILHRFILSSFGRRLHLLNGSNPSISLQIPKVYNAK